MTKIVNGKPFDTSGPSPVSQRMGLISGTEFVVFPDTEITVIDRTMQPQWSGMVEALVADLNAHMPDGGPTFVYTREDRNCEPINFGNIHGDNPVNAIRLCQYNSDPATDWNPTLASGYGASKLSADRSVIESGSAWVSSYNTPLDLAQSVLCHEIIHTLWEPIPGRDEHPDMAGTCADGTYGAVDAIMFEDLYGHGGTTPSTPSPTTPAPRPPKPGKPDKVHKPGRPHDKHERRDRRGRR